MNKALQKSIVKQVTSMLPETDPVEYVCIMWFKKTSVWCASWSDTEALDLLRNGSGTRSRLPLHMLHCITAYVLNQLRKNFPTKARFHGMFANFYIFEIDMIPAQ